jgi:4-amino-4-deoxy-L-arabinose transferase-like glycosyltransferase
MGAGILAKSAPALLVLVLAAVMWTDWRSKADTLRRLAMFSGGAMLVAGPWMVYTNLRFPAEAAAGTEIIWLHMTTALDGAGGPWWMFIKDMPRYFGELIYVPVAWFIVRVVRQPVSRGEWALLAWFVTPYLVFSAMPTKLPGFIAIGAPALFIVQAFFWCHLRDRLPSMRVTLRLATVVVLVLLVVLPARALLEPQGPFERRDRWPAFSRQLMTLERELGRTDAVIFNMPRALEAMFYSDYTAYVRLPRPAEVDELRKRGTAIVIFVPAGTSPPEVPDAWDARWLHEAQGASPDR